MLFAAGLAFASAGDAARKELRRPWESQPIAGPQAGEPVDIVLQFLRDETPRLGLVAEDVADVIVQSHHTSRQNGVTHIYLRQRLDGVEVFNGNMNAHVGADGSLLFLGSDFAAELRQAAPMSAPVLTAEQAVNAVASYLGLTIREALTVVEHGAGPDRQTLFSDGGVSLEPIPAQLYYWQDEQQGLHLTWSVRIYAKDALNWWTVLVDAGNGRVLEQHNWVAEDSYRVYPVPVESPIHTTPLPPADARQLLVNPADVMASPFGWHSTTMAPGEFQHSRGNNVDAYEDTNNSNNPTGGDAARSNGGATRVFDFPLDLTGQPSTYMPAAITNLFYWNNIIHDVFYQYGFDEASGNFQVNNYGLGGAGNDDVRAEAQDGGGRNNANFATPADGQRPRMQMYVWDPPPEQIFTVNSPPVVAGTYNAIPAAFGGAIPGPPGLTRNLVIVNDGGATPSEGCNPLVNGPAVSGNIAVMDRGNCSFVIKVGNAQAAGAVGVLMINNAPGGPIAMGGTDPTITIPAVMISLEDGALIRAQIPAPGVNVTLLDPPGGGPDLDGDLDSGIVTHEFGHGISNRLVGGRTNTSCLGNQEQAGEGWSDLFGLMLTHEVGDTGPDRRGIGTYAIGQTRDGNGIRAFPYSTSMTTDPRTYDDIRTAAVPHGVGSIWAALAWEAYWAMTNLYGYDPDLYNGTGGNNMAMLLIMDGLKLNMCSPGFVNNRDAILMADQINFAGANQCLLWQAFAKRGLGWSASQGSSASVADGTEAFDLPPFCSAAAVVTVQTCADMDLCQTTSTSNGTVEPGEEVTFTVTFRNSGTGDATDFRADIAVTNGTILSGGTVGGSPMLSITGGSSHMHDVVVRVDGDCGDTLDVDVLNMRAGTQTFGDETALCDRVIGDATVCEECCTSATDTGNVLLAVHDRVDVLLEFPTASPATWRMFRDSDKRMLRMTPLTPDVMTPMFTDPGAYAGPAGQVHHYRLTEVDCNSIAGP